MKTVRFVLLLLLAPALVLANIYSVPFRFATIQEAIDGVVNGDTILVEPSDAPYLGRVDYRGKRLVIGSRYLTTRSTEYIARTVIEGGWHGPVVKFPMADGGQSVFSGFTVQGGDTTIGGGIYIANCNPVLDGVRVYNNHSTIAGAGIYIQNSRTAIMNCTIDQNTTNGTGGGLCVTSNSTVTLENCTFLDNIADGNNARGGGIWVGTTSSIAGTRIQMRGNIGTTGAAITFETGSATVSTLTNCTIAGNGSFGQSGGIDMRDGPLTLLNSILWSNAPNNISNVVGYADKVTISYSDVKDGKNKIILPANSLVWGDGMITDDPRFADFGNGDYHLQMDSPCIDAGDPGSPKDPDSTVADMGMFSVTQTGVLYGYVTEADQDQTPIWGVSVTTSLGQEVGTDETGYYEISKANLGKFAVTFHLEGYADTTVKNVVLSAGQRKEVSVSLRSPQFALSKNEITVNLLPGEQTADFFNVINEGNGVLRFNLTRRERGEAKDPWSLLDSLPVGATLETDKVYGVVWADTAFFVCGSDADSTRVWAINREGKQVGRFTQMGGGIVGFTDLAFDGDLLWAPDRSTVYGMSRAGKVMSTFNSPFLSPQSLTWDTDRKWLWFVKKSRVGDQDIVATDRDGNIKQKVSRFGFDAITGIAYFSDDPDGYQLYLLHEDNDFHVIHKIRLTPGQEDTMYVTMFQPRDSRGPLGCDITDSYEADGSWVFMAMSDVLTNRGRDRLEVYSLMPYTQWMTVDPTGTILVNPGSERDINVSFTTIGPQNRFILKEGKYMADLVFTHNAGPDEVVVPVVMNVSDEAVSEPPIAVASGFGISHVYPNPFNAQFTVTFTLTSRGEVDLSLYDLAGRHVRGLVSGTRSAGTYFVDFTGEDISSGVYLLRLRGGDKTSTRKVVLLR